MKAKEEEKGLSEQGQGSLVSVNLQETADPSAPLEDMAMKTAARFFGKVMAPFLGVKGKITYAAPTEFITLQKRQMYQDFNFWSEDQTLLHFEFESDSITRKDMRRFREYEAVTSRSCRVPVITYVVCSSGVKKIRDTLTEGINTYRVKLIRLKNWNADKIFAALQKKCRNGERLKEKDMVSMLLTPLMSGKMSLLERFRQAFAILRVQQQEQQGEDEENERMQSVLYAFALKFLKGKELKEIEEEISMSVLGKRIYDDGRQEGRSEGRSEGIRAFIEGFAEFGISRENTVRKVMEKFGLSSEETKEYMSLYWQ